MNIVRLKSGQMILGEVSEKDGFTTIKHPLFILMMEEEFKFVDILKPISTDTSITFETNEIFATITPSSRVINHHREKFPSVVTPKAKKLIV